MRLGGGTPFAETRPGYAERYTQLRPVLETIARKHTEYGYRRTTTELQEGCGLLVNHKVVQKLHQLGSTACENKGFIEKEPLVRTQTSLQCDTSPPYPPNKSREVPCRI